MLSLVALRTQQVRIDECVTPDIPGSVQTSMVGSAYVLGIGADADYVALVQSMEDTVQQLVASGWVLGSADEYPTDCFKALRKGDHNVMVTSDIPFFSSYLTASEVCKVLQLKKKSDRIRVHRVIMDKETAEQVWEVFGKPA